MNARLSIATLSAVVCLVGSTSAFAQQAGRADDPMEGVAPIPAQPQQAPPPRTTTVIPAPTPTQPPAAAPATAAPATAAPATTAPPAAPAVNADGEPIKPYDQQRTTVTTFGIGPTWYLQTPNGQGARWSSPGLMLHLASRIPFDDHLGVGIRFAWGLTEFRRFESWTKAGYDVGEWSTHAYRDVYQWAAHPADEWRALRWMGAFFAFCVLWMPYIVSGAIYLLSPLAPTTYLEADVTFNVDVGTDRAGSGPYFKGGLALLGALHPHYNTMLGGLGPTAGIGFRAGKVDLGVHGTWSPPGLHGESHGESTHILISTFSLGVSGY